MMIMTKCRNLKVKFSEWERDRGRFLQADVPRQTITTVKHSHSSLFVDLPDTKHIEYPIHITIPTNPTSLKNIFIIFIFIIFIFTFIFISKFFRKHPHLPESHQSSLSKASSHQSSLQKTFSLTRVTSVKSANNQSLTESLTSLVERLVTTSLKKTSSHPRL